MISRIVTMAALMAGTALLAVSAHAQTGGYGQTTVAPGGAGASVGTTSTMPRGGAPTTATGAAGASTSGPGMGAQGTVNTRSNVNPPGTVGAQGNMGAQGTTQGGTMQQGGTTQGGTMQGGTMQGGSMQGGAKYQAQARSGVRGDAAERQITECLNNAAAQQQPLNSCRR